MYIFDVTITSAPPAGTTATVDFATIDGTATVANNDYQPRSGTINFTSDSPTLQQIVVVVNSDTTFEPNEIFTVRLSNLRGTAGALLVKADGIGTIFNDDVQTGVTPTPTPTATPTPTPTPMGLEGDVVDALGGPAGGDGVLANDVSRMRALVLGTATIDSATNQYQRADSAPRATRGDGCPLNAGDVTQTRRYNLGLDPPTPASGPTVPMPCAPTINFGELTPDPAGRTIRAVEVGPRIGDNVMVVIEMDSQGDEASASFTLNFDPLKLRNPVILAGTDVPLDTNLAVNTDDAAGGRIAILVDSTDTYSAGTRQIVTVTFEAANDSAFSAPITFGGDLAPQSVSNAYGTLLATTYAGVSARSVTISGRVTTPFGQGLRNALVTITDSTGNRRTAVTSSFGYYRFDDVAPGETYTIGVAARRYRFGSRVLRVADTLADVDFVGQE